MKQLLFVLPLLLAFGATHAAPVPRTAPTFLACTGKLPWWEGTWAKPVQGMNNDQATLTIQLSPDKRTATTMLINLGEQTFNIQASDEFYSGSKAVGQAALDGVINNAFISINRITGDTQIGFDVTNSPSDGSRWAFWGRCQPAVAKF